jgi:DNA helicase-2/ATP-dependent DNA helicase PcrA
MITEFIPRPAQEKILAYTHGTMGIAAVPGSGKTLILSALAAKLIADNVLAEGQEILIVTLTNSAVDNFSARIHNFLQAGERRLIPPYRVRTLHGLSHDIVRERPELVGLDANFQIIDEREANAIRKDVAHSWLGQNPDALDDYLDPEMEEKRADWIRREKLPNLVENIALSFIRTAKDKQWTPEALQAQLDQLPVPLPLAEMGASLYRDYQRALAYRGAVDFDDLIRMSILALRSDDELRTRLRDLWPYILEDEAQDSSLLQQEILGMLAGPNGNWVRVGDPNQAIFESFTTADPDYLREFIDEADFSRELPNSGRSTRSIIEIANWLIDWSQREHPTLEVRDALSKPYIQPTPEGDPQPNPDDRADQIHLIPTAYSPEAELNAVADSAARWLEEHPDETVAILTPRNNRGFVVNDELRRRKIETVDSLLRSSNTTRLTAGALANILKYLSDPGSASKLATVYQVWRREDREEEQVWAEVKGTAKLLRGCKQVEDFVNPAAGRDWLESVGEALSPDERDQLARFRVMVQHWHNATELPFDQIILTLSQELFTDPTDLAIAHKLAVLLRQARTMHPDWGLPEMTAELAVIAKNERRFLGFDEDDTGFDPDQHKGKVTIATVHKAKGLEWDRVYLMAVNNYNFPAGMTYDRYISERWYIRDGLNLGAETLAQLDAALSTSEYDWYEQGVATYTARMDYVRERLRLLYVGITRARKELVITWNTGRRGDSQPAIPFVALQAYWDERSET